MSNDLPSTREVADLLQNLLGRAVSVEDNRCRLTGDGFWAR